MLYTTSPSRKSSRDEHAGFPLYVYLHSAMSMPPEGRYGRGQGTSQSRRNADDVLEASARKNAREAKGKKILIWQTPLFEGNSGIVGRRSRGNC